MVTDYCFSFLTDQTDDGSSHKTDRRKEEAAEFRPFSACISNDCFFNNQNIKYFLYRKTSINNLLVYIQYDTIFTSC